MGCPESNESSLILVRTDNQGSDTRRGMGIVMLNTIGQCGPLPVTKICAGNVYLCRLYRVQWIPGVLFEDDLGAGE